MNSGSVHLSDMEEYGRVSSLQMLQHSISLLLLNESKQRCTRLKQVSTTSCAAWCLCTKAKRVMGLPLWSSYGYGQERTVFGRTIASSGQSCYNNEAAGIHIQRNVRQQMYKMISLGLFVRIVNCHCVFNRERNGSSKLWCRDDWRGSSQSLCREREGSNL